MFKKAQCHHTVPLKFKFFSLSGCVHGPEQGGRDWWGGADLAGLQRGGGRQLSGTMKCPHVLDHEHFGPDKVLMRINADPGH